MKKTCLIVFLLFTSFLNQAQDTIQVKQKKNPKLFISVSYGGPILAGKIAENIKLLNFYTSKSISSNNKGIFVGQVAYQIGTRTRIGVFASGAGSLIHIKYSLSILGNNYSEELKIRNYRFRIVPRFDYIWPHRKDKKLNYFISGGIGIAIFNTIIDSNYGSFKILSGRYLQGVYSTVLVKVGVSYFFDNSTGLLIETGTCGPLLNFGMFAKF